MNTKNYGIDNIKHVGHYYHDHYIVILDDIGEQEQNLEIEPGMLAVITTDGDRIMSEILDIETFCGTFQDKHDDQFRIYFFGKA